LLSSVTIPARTRRNPAITSNCLQDLPYRPVPTPPTVSQILSQTRPGLFYRLLDCRYVDLMYAMLYTIHENHCACAAHIVSYAYACPRATSTRDLTSEILWCV
jgi:hypothetical protein